VFREIPVETREIIYTYADAQPYNYDLTKIQRAFDARSTACRRVHINPCAEGLSKWVFKNQGFF